MKNKKILVLGGNGFIGRNLVEYLVSLNHIVTSFDIAFSEPKNNQVNYVVGSFFDEQMVEKVVKDQDIIFHCISTLNPSKSIKNYVNGFETDFIATVKMMSFLENTETKVVFLSSGGSVYGDPEVIPTKEEALVAPGQYYACLKVCVEEFLLTTNRLFHKNHKIARVSNPYGPGQNSNSGVGFINIAVEKCLSNETIQIWGDGENLRDYIYIQNVCEMLYAIGEDSSDTYIYNVSSGEGESLKSILKILESLKFNPKVEYFPSRSIDVKNIILDNQKIMNIAKCKLISIHDGIKFLLKEKM